MSARRSVHVEGLGHGSLPIPVASTIGGLIATGGIRGVDPQTGELPDTRAQQARQMFANLIRVIEEAGGNADTILKVTVFATDRSARADVDPPWMELFPDPQSRPARHLQVCDLPGGMLLQCDALAVRIQQSDGEPG